LAKISLMALGTRAFGNLGTDTELHSHVHTE